MRSLSRRSPFRLLTLAVLCAPAGLGACSSSSSPSSGAPITGQTSFVSAPTSGGNRAQGGAAENGGDFASGTAAAPTTGGNVSTTTTRAVEETDLYRVEGSRLYYLNSYRGLMVFDVTDVDHPKLLGRSPIFGTPVDMVVNQGIATVVVGDWYGQNDDGSPFHGSIVRGLDANDPKNIKVIGDARLGGWVRDDRVVGNVLYAVSEEEPTWEYGWEGALGVSNVAGGVAISPIGGSGQAGVIVSSVSFASGKIKAVASKTFDGYGGVFNVTAKSILFAHPDVPAQDGGYVAPTKTDLVYLDITDPGGAIVERSTLRVDGVVGTWGPDNGRWNLDFSDGKTAHVVGSPDGNYGSQNQPYVLAIADFSNPDQPQLQSELAIPGAGWVPTARFDSNRMYLSPDSDYSPTGSTTPLEVFDLSNPAAPFLAGKTTLAGNVWLMIPSDAGTRLFVLGSDSSQNSSQIALNYLDVTDATKPTVVGTSTFGDGWASTPASGTFKAFTVDPLKGLVVLPFSGWDASKNNYNDGVQLIEFTPSSITTAGAAHTRGWVERGIFVSNRVVSLSDLALSVVDYSNPISPKVTAELTLARSIVTSQPTGSTIAEVSSDWWDNDVTHSDVRILPVADADEKADESAALDTQVDGVNAQVFSNGTLNYIVTNVQITVPCGKSPSGGIDTPVPTDPGTAVGVTAPDKPQACYGWQQQVQVIDLANGGAKARGKIVLPTDPSAQEGYWGYYGCYSYDWFNGGDIVQVGASTLAFRRWHPYFGASGQFLDESSDLFVVDLSNPDAPAFASTVITRDPTGWWGDMQVVQNTLYTTHTEWLDNSANNPEPTARYYLDRIDLSDPKHPKVGSKINVPGVLVGGSASDPTLLYTIDYRWDTSNVRNDLDVVKIDGDLAYLQSRTPIDGYVGNVIVRGSTAYLSAESDSVTASSAPTSSFHQIDLTSPDHPVDRVTSGTGGWGALLDVQGDRALVTSGWGADGLDIYRLSPTAPAVYDQFVRTRGWSVNSASRQGNKLFLSSGYWGVQTVTLQ